MTSPAFRAGALALGLIAPAQVTAMTEPPRALSLFVEERDDIIEVRLIGLAQRAQEVSYALEVTGQSTSRHRGRTTLAAGNEAVLSTMRASAGATWCVRLTAQEEGQEPYEITRGDCAAG